jgi:hypothetical protein
MKVNGLIGTLASIVMPLQVLTHAQPALAHQAENRGEQGLGSLLQPPNCDVFFKNKAGEWEQGISEHVANKACVEMGQSIHQGNVDHVKEDPHFVAPLLRVDYNGEKILINPPETPPEYHPYPLN